MRYDEGTAIADALFRVVATDPDRLTKSFAHALADAIHFPDGTTSPEILPLGEEIVLRWPNGDIRVGPDGEWRWLVWSSTGCERGRADALATETKARALARVTAPGAWRRSDEF